MAWTEECKIAFKMNADHQVWSQKGKKSIAAVLKKLSKESGIPYNTLKRWYYEKEEEKKARLSSIKNDTASEPTENKKEINKNPPPPPRQTCIKCKKNIVEFDSKTGKERTIKSKYYGLCTPCRKKSQIICDAIALANKEESGEWIICPECHHYFLIPNKGEIL